MKKISQIKNLILSGILLVFAVGCREEDDGGNGKRILNLAASGVVKSLDPAQCADVVSRDMTGAIYDTLLQYDYQARPYKLVPSMLAEMPKISEDGKIYTFKLRSDLYFHEDVCFKDKSERQLTADDVIYSFRRIINPENHSPLFWIFRDKLAGIKEYRQNQTAPLTGLKRLDKLSFQIILNHSDYRFLYNLALPGCGIVSRKAAQFYHGDLSEHPVGSGPFKLKSYQKGYRIELVRYADYRPEFYAFAKNPDDRKRNLPLADGVIYSQIKRPFTAWLLFLQGEIDMAMLDKDNVDMVAGSGDTLSDALSERQIHLQRSMDFSIRYIGFNFLDQTLGDNPKLRQALSAAYNFQRRVDYSNHQLLKSAGPIIPGVDGYDANLKNPYGYNPELAKKLLVEAGYPDGLKRDGEPLTLTFDLNGNSSVHHQIGEMMVSDMEKIGVKIIPRLNSSPRFFEKLRRGEMQLFYLSWVGDYPDAENFLQLFYSKNGGSCNRTFFNDAEFDRQFEAIIPMKPSLERTERYKAMAKYIMEQTPWIFDGIPVNYQLYHGFVENFIPHNFGFSNLKYLSVNPQKRQQIKKSFKPLDFGKL